MNKYEGLRSHMIIGFVFCFLFLKYIPNFLVCYFPCLEPVRKSKPNFKNKNKFFKNNFYFSFQILI